MNQHSRTPGSTPQTPPARPATTSTGGGAADGSGNAETLRWADELARSSADRRSRADAALGDADAARGYAEEAAGRGDDATAGAEWSRAAGLDGLAAHEAAVSDIDARASAAVAKSTTVPPSTGRGRAGRKTPGVSGQEQGRTPAPAPPAGPARRIP